MYRKIVVPLDGSQTAEAVLPHARALAEKLALKVELLSAIDLAELGRNVATAAGLHLDRFVEDESCRLREYQNSIAESFAPREISGRIENAPAAELILEAGAENDVLVAMATHGRSGLNRWLLGSVAEKVLRATTAPLLLVRAAENRSTAGKANFDSIVVPLDGSALAERALPPAIELARELDVEMILFRAYTIPFIAFGGAGFYAADLDRLMAEIAADASEYLRDKVDALKKAGVKRVSSVVKEGLSADEILTFTRQRPGSLIAMCTHGRSGFRRWALGSVTETVARHADVPVLIVRAG